VAKKTTKTPVKPSASDITSTAPNAPAAVKPDVDAASAATAEESKAPSAAEILSADRTATKTLIRSRLPGKKQAPAKKPAKRSRREETSDDDAIDIETGEIETNLGDDDDDDDHSVARTSEKKPAPRGEPAKKVAAVSDALLVEAQEAGIPLALARQAGSEELLKGMITLARRPEAEPRNRRDDSVDDEENDDPPPPPKKEKKKPAESEESDAGDFTPIALDDFISEHSFNDTTTAILKKIESVFNQQGQSSAARIAKLEKELAETKAKAEGVETEVRSDKHKLIDKQIDECFKGLPEKLQDVYGTIPTSRLPKGSAAAVQRSRMIRMMGAIQLAQQQAGEEQLEIPELFEEAKRRLHRKDYEAEVEERVLGRVKQTATTKGNQEVLRPNGRSGGGKTADREQNAVDAIDRIFSRRNK
jgi:hypothetical protein